MFNINPFEILVITLIFLMLFGPEKLPEIAMQVGKFVRELREASSAATAEITRELHRAAADNQEVAGDIRSIGDQARRFLQSTSDAVHNTVTQAYQETGAAVGAATAAAVPWAADAAPGTSAGEGSAASRVEPDGAASEVQSEGASPAAEDPEVEAILADVRTQARAAGADEGAGSKP
ncbi:MAG TPA: twin-arginine translocase TatA/TatE family subunit [Anaerolineae bacterium]|nr:twin-arginine translocase TatA/TatE family subunit [Ardenticatenia bacterium]HQZ70775.1 twin-arginine translocase TatA/TatE family subunit [Anaerolineae bacterium]HRA21695.1 twin-arginine translocase TatA/TatE family subunit [Anaerolineae bacterium]